MTVSVRKQVGPEVHAIQIRQPFKSTRTKRACRRRRHEVVARNRILLRPSEIENKGLIRFPASDDRAKHILQILKLQPGDEVKVGIINGAMGRARVAQISPALLLECQHWQAPLPTVQLYLLLAMPRPKVMKRLWSTLACLGVTRVYITGAEKVEKVYFGSHALDPSTFIKELIIGAEQAGDTRLPAVFFSKSLKATLASLELTGAPGASPIHKHNGEQVQTLLAEGATEHNRVSQRNLPPTPGHQQTGSMLWGQTGETGGKADVVNHGGKQKEASLASCAAAEKSNSQAAPVGAADVDGSCYVKRGMADAVKLLAHTDGGVPVRQAVLNHFSQGTAEAASTCRSNLTGVKDATLQLPRSELSAAAAVTTDMTTDVTTDMTTDVTTDNSAKIGPIAILAVGPEGGCTPSEVALLTEELAFQNVTTAGGRTLDTTTAVISLVTLVGEAMMSCYSHDNSRFLRGSKVSIY